MEFTSTIRTRARSRTVRGSRNARRVRCLGRDCPTTAVGGNRSPGSEEAPVDTGDALAPAREALSPDPPGRPCRAAIGRIVQSRALIAMLVPSAVAVIPLCLVMHSLGWIDTYQGIVASGHREPPACRRPREGCRRCPVRAGCREPGSAFPAHE